MNSSTSSSNPNFNSDNSNWRKHEMNNNTSKANHSDADTRKTYLKIILAITIGMGLAMGIVQALIMPVANKQGVTARVSQARAALPRILSEPHDLVMFYGSSMTRAGFSPRKFDRDVNVMGKNVKSFNFGFGGLNPFFQDYLSRRIAESFVEKNRRLKLAMVEFNPFQTTTTRWNRAKSILDSFLAMLASDSELLEITRKDLTRGIRLFNIKYLRGNISAEMITSFYGRALFPPVRRSQFKDSEETITARRKLGNELGELFEKDYPDFNGEQWYYPWRGAGTSPEDRSEHTLEVFDEYYKVTQTDAQMKNDRLSRIRNADIEDMHFEPLLVDSFIQTVKNFQRFSDKVEVILLPKNTKWIHYSEEGKIRFAEAIKKIELATGLKIRNHQTLDVINPGMFRDTTHLSRYRGDIAYTDYLVKTYAKEL